MHRRSNAAGTFATGCWACPRHHRDSRRGARVALRPPATARPVPAGSRRRPQGKRRRRGAGFRARGGPKRPVRRRRCAVENRVSYTADASCYNDCFRCCPCSPCRFSRACAPRTRRGPARAGRDRPGRRAVVRGSTPTGRGPLPDDWLLGNVVGVATDSHDNVWIIHRPNSQRGSGDDARRSSPSTPTAASCTAGADPATATRGAPRPHGIHVDHRDNVWVGFGGGLPYDLSSRATTDNAHVLKFTPEGDFLLQIGEFGNGAAGSGQHPLPRPAHRRLRRPRDRRGLHQRRLHQPAGDRVRCEHRRLPPSLGGAYGNPPDDGPRPAFSRDGPLPQAVRHAALRRAGGPTAGVYVCDRGKPAPAGIRAGRRIRDRGARRRAPAGRHGRRGALGPRVLARPRTAGSCSSPTAGRTPCTCCAATPLEGGGDVRPPRGVGAGQFESPHSLAVDSRGNLFVGETLDGRRVQKFSPTE